MEEVENHVSRLQVVMLVRSNTDKRLVVSEDTGNTLFPWKKIGCLSETVCVAHSFCEVQ